MKHSFPPRRPLCSTKKAAIQSELRTLFVDFCILAEIGFQFL